MLRGLLESLSDCDSHLDLTRQPRHQCCESGIVLRAWPQKFGIIRNMKPTAEAERVLSIDVLRGIALSGVLLVNLLNGFRVSLSGHILGNDEPLGPGGSILLRRFGALTVLGLIHLIFVWNGDILTLYGICGLILIPLLRLPSAALAGLGALLIAAPHIALPPVRFPTTQRCKS
jgi:uncharacterized membrane protein